MERIVFNVGPYSFTTSAFLIGLILSQKLSLEEQDSIGNWLQLVGLTMQTYASQQITIDASKIDNKDKSNDSSDIEKLKKTIKDIEEELDKIYAEIEENENKLFLLGKMLYLK